MNKLKYLKYFKVVVCQHQYHPPFQVATAEVVEEEEEEVKSRLLLV